MIALHGSRQSLPRWFLLHWFLPHWSLPHWALPYSDDLPSRVRLLSEPPFRRQRDRQVADLINSISQRRYVSGYAVRRLAFLPDSQTEGERLCGVASWCCRVSRYTISLASVWGSNISRRVYGEASRRRRVARYTITEVVVKGASVAVRMYGDTGRCCDVAHLTGV
jgi:hypothetical protein